MVFFEGQPIRMSPASRASTYDDMVSMYTGQGIWANFMLIFSYFTHSDSTCEDVVLQTTGGPRRSCPYQFGYLVIVTCRLCQTALSDGFKSSIFELDLR